MAEAAEKRTKMEEQANATEKAKEEAREAVAENSAELQGTREESQ